LVGVDPAQEYMSSNPALTELGALTKEWKTLGENPFTNQSLTMLVLCVSCNQSWAKLNLKLMFLKRAALNFFNS
jgi:hypothetical protein